MILGDCLEEMKSIPDKSVDFICCDPPYGVLTYIIAFVLNRKVYA